MKRQTIDGHSKAREAVGNATELSAEDVHQKTSALPAIQTRFPTLSPPALGSPQTTKTYFGPNELTTPQQPRSAFGTYQITHILDPVAAKHAVSHDHHPTKNTPGTKRNGQKAVEFEKEHREHHCRINQGILVPADRAITGGWIKDERYQFKKWGKYSTTWFV